MKKKMKVISVNILTILLLIATYQFLEAFDLPPGCLDAFRRASLQVHNVLRGKHNSPSLNRDSGLDASALKYANFLAVNDVCYPSLTLNSIQKIRLFKIETRDEKIVTQ